MITISIHMFLVELWVIMVLLKYKVMVAMNCLPRVIIGWEQDRQSFWVQLLMKKETGLETPRLVYAVSEDAKRQRLKKL